MAKKVVRKKPAVLKRAEAYQSVFSGPVGLWVLHDLMQEHHILGTTLRSDGSVDTAKEGERLVVLRILAQLNINVAELRERIADHVRTMEE